MKKEKKQLFEQEQFADAVAAQAYLTDCNKKLERSKIGLIVAALVPVIDAIAASILNKMGNGDAAFGVWLVVAIVAYLIGGGLGTALKLVLRVTSVAWFIFPIFPIDIAIAIGAFCIAGAVALFLPVIFVLMARHQLKLNKEAAEYILGVNNVVVNEAEAVY